MQLIKASRKNIKIRMALSGPSGAGKTYSALLIAYGICGDWNKIAVIDTENQSADLYAHLGSYNVLSITAPYSPEKYMQAISFCEQSEIRVIIIDSMSHEWEGQGGILDQHSKMTGNSFANWGKLTPRHTAFVQALLQSPVHIIATLRKKQDYILTDKNGKMVPEKVGLKPIQREGMDYEFTLVFDLDIHHNATASKDRTGLFTNQSGFKLSVETGKAIYSWCQEGHPSYLQNNEPNDPTVRINKCSSISELLALYKSIPDMPENLLTAFARRKQELQPFDNLLQHTKNASTNGIHE